MPFLGPNQEMLLWLINKSILMFPLTQEFNIGLTHRGAHSNLRRGIRTLSGESEGEQGLNTPRQIHNGSRKFLAEEFLLFPTPTNILRERTKAQHFFSSGKIF